MENRQVENKIKQLRNKAIELEQNKKKQVEKTDKIRKPIIANIIIAGCIHFVGSFIHPLVVIGALTFLLANTITGAVLIFGGEDKEAKIQKEIDAYNDEADKLEAQLEMEKLEENMEYIPTPRIDLEETPLVMNTPKTKIENKPRR